MLFYFEAVWLLCIFVTQFQFMNNCSMAIPIIYSIVSWQSHSLKIDNFVAVWVAYWYLYQRHSPLNRKIVIKLKHYNFNYHMSFEIQIKIRQLSLKKFNQFDHFWFTLTLFFHTMTCQERKKANTQNNWSFGHYISNVSASLPPLYERLLWFRQKRIKHQHAAI